MAFTITNIATKVTEAGGVKFAVAQPCTTQRASLYGVEATCQNGFASDPALDIYVFTNPLAAVAKIESLTGQTLDHKTHTRKRVSVPDWQERMTAVTVAGMNKHGSDGCLMDGRHVRSCRELAEILLG